MTDSNYRERCLEAKGEECVICGSEQEVVAHHLDGDRDNNDLDNLEPVCRSCHNRIHGNHPDYREWWEILGVENPPAFTYAESEQGPLYPRGETWEDFEDSLLEAEAHLRERGVRNAQKREYYDAVLRLAVENPERVGELVLEARRDS